MKIRIYLTIVLAGFSLLASCSYLDQVPEDELTLEMVFNDKTRTEDWLAGIYAGIADPYWDYMNKAGYDMLGDDMTLPTAWTTFDWTVLHMVAGNWSPATEWKMYYWSELPKYIRSAYIFLDHVKPLPQDGVTASEVALMKNEARFMIAYYYWLLIETYGPIPFSPGLVDAGASNEELLIGQTPFYTIVDWIDKELTEAAKGLPAYYTNNNKFGRATSVMCHAVRARMLLFAASDLVNGNPDYAGHVNKKGEALFSTQHDPSKWTKAAEACRELIELAEGNGYRLYTELTADGKIDPFLSYQNMMFTRWTDGNKEILFARPGGCNIWDYEKHATPRGSGGNGGLGVSQSLVDAFFMKNGLPIDDSASGYSDVGYSTASDRRNTEWIEGSPTETPGEITTAGTYNMYCNREARFYVTVLYNDAWFRESNRRTEFHNPDMDGGGYNSPQAGYLLRKKVHPDHNELNDNYIYRPGILYRLGEAYLNYAEALNECDPGNADILVYLNKIRERAGIPTYGSGPDQIAVDASDQIAMRKLIRMERRVELCVEGVRYNDLRRWKEAGNVLNEPVYGMNVNATTRDGYFRRTQLDYKHVYRKAFYFMPVPSWEMDKNPNLVQNPYWSTQE